MAKQLLCFILEIKDKRPSEKRMLEGWRNPLYGTLTLCEYVSKQEFKVRIQRPWHFDEGQLVLLTLENNKPVSMMSIVGWNTADILQEAKP